MKAISLWQPCASLMAAGIKTIETRSWSTSYRGPLLICAAKHTEWDTFLYRHVKTSPEIVAFLKSHAGGYPEGVALAVVDLYDVNRTEATFPTTLERALGKYTPQRFAWLTRNCRPLAKPIPVRGRQRLFNVQIWAGQLSIESTARERPNPFEAVKKILAESTITEIQP